MATQANALVPLTVAELVQFLSQLLTTRYIALSGVVLLVYDWIITFDEEVNDIWPAKLSITKVTFLSNRYINITSQIMMVVHFTGFVETKSAVTCKFYVIGYGIEVFIALASVHLLVIMRAWAIWNRRLWITVALALAYVLYTLACVALIIFAVITAADKFIFNVNGTCISFTIPTLWYVWVASLTLEYVTFAFTLASISRNYTGATPGFRGLSPLARKLYLSAFAYISFSTVCHVFNMIMWGIFWKSPFNMLAVTFTCCLMNVAGQRFVLDLRRFNRERMLRSHPGLPHIVPQSGVVDSDSFPRRARITPSHTYLLRPR